MLSWGNLNQGHQLTNKLIFVGGTHCRSVGRQLDNELEELGVVELEGEVPGADYVGDLIVFWSGPTVECPLCCRPHCCEF